MSVTGRSSPRISPGREAAFNVLRSVEEGAYASDELRTLTASLSPRDAGLAGQIVFGSLRFRLQLDHLIRVYSGRSVAPEPAVANILRMALFQLRYLERIPPHAAVDEAVELAKKHKRAAAGLVNAVLRKVTRDPVAWPDREIQLSCPLWLLERWDRHFGRAAADGIARAALQEPVPYVRVAPGSPSPEGLQLEATDIAGAFQVLSGERGDLRLHDIGSQSLIPLAQLQPGETFLDLCSAPGNKTRQALETPLALAVASDIGPSRLATVDARNRVVLDGTTRLPFPRDTFDCVFIDAPCSGTGTLARNPEIKWRVQSSDFRDFGEKQKRLVRQALTVLKPGGRLLYATCSLEEEENEGVIAAELISKSGLQPAVERWRLPGRDPGDGFYAAVFHRK